MWHQRFAHFNLQDLRRLLQSSGEQITNLDVELVMDHMDIEPIIHLDIKLVMDPMDEPPITPVQPVNKPEKPS